MKPHIFVTQSYFDGNAHHDNGPYSILVKDGLIEDIVPEDATAPGFSPDGAWPVTETETVKAPFLMPGLVEAHCHLFLDGGELDFKKRSAYLKSSFDEMICSARLNLTRNMDAGITLMRDAGDSHGINHLIKEEVEADPECNVNLLSAGAGIRMKKRYGSFFAQEVADEEEIVATIRKIAPTIDQLKIVMTGIIDFEKGIMKGGPQFTLDEAKLIVQTAKEEGLLTFAHCSGEDGLEISVEAGINCIEHGFFMNRSILEQMAEKRIAWTPTFSPVDFQYERPELAGWDEDTCVRLRAILDNHDERAVEAYEVGVPVITGSDSGSYGVVHGEAPIDELFYLHKAGATVTQVLTSSTSLPRELWGCPSANIEKGNAADFVLLDGSPYDNLEHVRKPQAVFLGGLRKLGEDE
ncbi:MAG: amidohydrolase family protein [Planctomycetota bacterium]|nr:amidohydrolase family protein [Planctomycetota bacterium]